MTTLWPTKGNIFCVIPNDCRRQPFVFKANEYLFVAPQFDFPPNAWSGSATGSSMEILVGEFLLLFI